MEEVSAFAVYSGKVLLSKNQKRRRKRKENSIQSSPSNKQNAVSTVNISKSKAHKLKNKMEKEKPLRKKRLRKHNKVQSFAKNNNTFIDKKSKKNKVAFTKSANEIVSTMNEDINVVDPISMSIGFNDKLEPNQNDSELPELNYDVLSYLQIKNIKKESGIDNNTKVGSNAVKNGIKKGKIKKRTQKVKLKKASVTDKISNERQDLVDQSEDNLVEDESLLFSGNNSSSKNFKIVHRSPISINKPIFQLSSDSNCAPVKFKTSRHKYKYQLLVAEARQIARSKTGSETTGKKAFERLIEPFSVDEFMRVYWEKVAVHIPSSNTRFVNLISTPMIDDLLRYNVVMFGKHLDVTTYTNGVRETLNPEGRAHPHVIWDYYSNGCSIRLLNPQYFIQSLHILLATLQEYFGCLVGANAYLTPPNSQGFAPHYDDIEAFVYQVEGRKHWKIYTPRSVSERLPRYSSPNFAEDEVGNPILDVVLSPGDVLYFPRGYIHQAKTMPGEHSLHVTISTYQKTSWCDLLEKVLPLSLKKASEKDLDFRKGLPIGYLQNAGFARSKSYLRKELMQGLKTLVSRLEKHLDVDSGVDQMGVQFMHDALPPVFNEDELKCSVYNGGLVMKENGALENSVQLNFDSKIRLLRAHICRLVEEVDKSEHDVEPQMRLYYTVDNSREYHGEEPQFLILPPEMIPAVHFLISAYPGFVTVGDLPCKTDEEKITLACDLWDRGLLMTDIPLELDNKANRRAMNEVELDNEELNSSAASDDEIVFDCDESSPDNFISTV